MPKSKWSNETSALKKIQLQFEFQKAINKRLNHDAADNNIKPSDIVRKLVGLPYKKIQRTRVGLSLNKDDLNTLAKRYDIDTADENEIKRRVLEEVNLHYHNKGKHKDAI
ncbi:MAG: hypothetical protein O7D86_12305 [Proteobacteria bacterium]|nr:hypothetical protein [Pseudomonadota bacterium]